MVLLGFRAKRERHARAHRAAEGIGRFGFVQPHPQPDVCGNRFDPHRSFLVVWLLEFVDLHGGCRNSLSFIRHVI